MTPVVGFGAFCFCILPSILVRSERASLNPVTYLLAHVFTSSGDMSSVAVQPRRNPACFVPCRRRCISFNRTRSSTLWRFAGNRVALSKVVGQREVARACRSQQKQMHLRRRVRTPVSVLSISCRPIPARPRFAAEFTQESDRRNVHRSGAKHPPLELVLTIDFNIRNNHCQHPYCGHRFPLSCRPCVPPGGSGERAERLSRAASLQYNLAPPLMIKCQFV